MFGSTRPDKRSKGSKVAELLPFIVAGLTAGSVYGLAGVGLVLTYKTSGVFNFAHGALATVGAYVFYVLVHEQELPWQLAALVVVVIVGPAIGLVLELITRRIGTAPLATQVASTVGLLLAIVAVVQLSFPATEIRRVEVFLSADFVTWGETRVRVADIITFGFAALVTAVLAGFFRWSRSGVKMRAVVDNPPLLALFGISPAATRRSAWILGSMLVTASGVLFSPLLALDPFTLTFLVVAAFGAAAVGAFTSLPGTFGGGLAIGAVAALCQKWFLSGPLSGLSSSLPFVVLFLVLLFFPRRFLAGKRFVAQRTRPSWTPPVQVRVMSSLALVALLLLVPSFAGVHLTDWTLMVALTILFLSLSLLVKTSGQVSLCHITFAAMGATAFSHFAVDRGMPWILALLAAGLVVVPVGAVLAIPAIRLTGLYLALATFGFGLTLQHMFYATDLMFGDTGSGVPMPRPDFVHGISGDEGFYYVTIAFAVGAAALVFTLINTRLGRLLRGISDSPLAVETNGANAHVTRVLVFCVSTFLAAIAGALGGVASQSASAESFNPFTSLIYFVVIVVVIGGEPWNAVLAASALTLVPSYSSSPDAAAMVQLVFGALAILLAVVSRDVRGVPRFVRSFVDARLRKQPPRIVARTVRRNPVVASELELRDITVRFGGVTAVSNFGLMAPTGQITGLVGPNGAGKTTTFNAASGLLRPSAGIVLLDGHDVTRRSASARARRGLGRTFQRMELLESLSVCENVRLGAEASLSGLNPVTHILSRRGETRYVAESTQEAIELCELAELADRAVHHLSTGQRRLVELARCLAGDFRIILMDEPSSGLDHAETRRFGQILVSAVAERGVGILLVEHDMALVAEVCAEVTVLDFGRPIFRGTPVEMLASSVVRAAYLGDPSVEDAAQAFGASTRVGAEQ